jgi:hypothetical protein
MIAAVEPFVITMPQFVGKEFAGQTLIRYMTEPNNDPNCWTIIGETENEIILRVSGHFVDKNRIITSVKRVK